MFKKFDVLFRELMQDLTHLCTHPIFAQGKLQSGGGTLERDYFPLSRVHRSVVGRDIGLNVDQKAEEKQPRRRTKAGKSY